MIYKYLDLSTGHVSRKTAKWLDNNPDGIIMYLKGEYGWIIHVSSEEYDKNIPNDLIKVIEYAKSKECGWIMFDADGEVIEELELFNW